jgi:hypothetical protein
MFLLLIIFWGWAWGGYTIFKGMYMIFTDVKNSTHQDITKLCTIATILVTSTYLIAITIAPEVRAFLGCA